MNKLIEKCVNFNRKIKLNIKPDSYFIYKYIINKIGYINPRDPRFIKLILTMPTIETMNISEFKNIKSSKYIVFLKNLKKRLMNIEYDISEDEKTRIIESFIYDKKFLINQVNNVYVILKILFENDIMTLNIYGPNKKIEQSITK